MMTTTMTLFGVDRDNTVADGVGDGDAVQALNFVTRGCMNQGDGFT